MKNTEKYKQEMLAQVDMRLRKGSQTERKELCDKKYLGEIIELEKPNFGSNNLILAPVGSGKTHLIENVLIPENFSGKALYLTSNSALKDSLCPDNNIIRKALADKGESVCFYTTANKSRYGDKPYKVHVMTYAEFGERVMPPHQTFTDDIELIFCDEIHSLPTYFAYDQNYRLGSALNWLLRKHKNKQVFYFTATKENIDKLEARTPGYFSIVETFNYLDHPDIRKYVANSTYLISHLNQLRPHFQAKLESFNYKGYKALAFTKLITEQKKIEDMAIEEGFKPIVLWSINNEEEMNEEQLRVRQFILNTGNIPEPYNLLIINGSMQEGWNLYDDKVTLIILDTVDITEQIQALGRMRADIDIVIKKTNDKDVNKYTTKVPEPYLDINLTSADKQKLCEDLYILDARGRLIKWQTIKTYIEASGYTVEDKVDTSSGKNVRVSIITLKD